MYCTVVLRHTQEFFSPDDNPTGPLCRGSSSSSINYICLNLSFFFIYFTTFFPFSFDLSSFFYVSLQLFYIMCQCLKRHRPTLTSRLSPGWGGRTYSPSYTPLSTSITKWESCGLKRGPALQPGRCRHLQAVGDGEILRPLGHPILLEEDGGTGRRRVQLQAALLQDFSYSPAGDGLLLSPQLINLIPPSPLLEPI